jgi:hypothetical protein
MLRTGRCIKHNRGCLKNRGCPKVTRMKYRYKVQGNAFALVQIFNAIPSPSFSAPAELRTLTPLTGPLPLLIQTPHFLFVRAQYILGFRQGRIPSKGGCARLNLQCRSDISLHLYLHLISPHFGTNSKNKMKGVLKA